MKKIIVISLIVCMFFGAVAVFVLDSDLNSDLDLTFTKEEIKKILIERTEGIILNLEIQLDFIETAEQGNYLQVSVMEMSLKRGVEVEVYLIEDLKKRIKILSDQKKESLARLQQAKEKLERLKAIDVDDIKFVE